jgi:hypothetical protein
MGALGMEVGEGRRGRGRDVMWGEKSCVGGEAILSRDPSFDLHRRVELVTNGFFFCS